MLHLASRHEIIQPAKRTVGRCRRKSRCRSRMAGCSRLSEAYADRKLAAFHIPPVPRRPHGNKHPRRLRIFMERRTDFAETILTSTHRFGQCHCRTDGHPHQRHSHTALQLERIPRIGSGGDRTRTRQSSERFLRLQCTRQESRFANTRQRKRTYPPADCSHTACQRLCRI